MPDNKKKLKSLIILPNKGYNLILFFFLIPVTFSEGNPSNFLTFLSKAKISLASLPISFIESSLESR